MSSITIDYENLRYISENASTAASRMEEYIDELSKRVCSKYSGISGGANAKTQNSEYYVNQKISQLRKKKEDYSNFSQTIARFSDKAQQIDRDVAQHIKASKDQFIQKHAYIKTGLSTAIKSWFVDLKNSCPLAAAIGQAISNVLSGLKNIGADLRHWYQCGGGKETLDLVFAIGKAIALVVIAVVAVVFTPITGIVALCAAIGAVIAAINGLVNIGTSIQAKIAKDNGDPAWAKIYGDQDTAQDFLRQHRFKHGLANKLSYAGATIIDAAVIITDTVALGDGILNARNIFKEIKASAGMGKRSFGFRFKQYVLNKNHYTKDASGNFKKWRGIINKRAEIRTLRGYKVTKAMSIAQYEKSLTPRVKHALKIQKHFKKAERYIGYANKATDLAFHGQLGIDYAAQVAAKEEAEKFKLRNPIKKAKGLLDGKKFKAIAGDHRKLSAYRRPSPRPGYSVRIGYAYSYGY